MTTKAPPTVATSLPEHPSEWSFEHDFILYRRVKKLLMMAPPGAMARMRPYLLELVQTTSPPGQQVGNGELAKMRTPAEGGLIGHAPAESKR